MEAKIHLDKFPTDEYGKIYRKVKYISNSQNQDGSYEMIIDLGSKLITSKNKKINFNGEIIGNCRITVSKKLFLSFIFDKLKSKIIIE